MIVSIRAHRVFSERNDPVLDGGPMTHM